MTIKNRLALGLLVAALAAGSVSQSQAELLRLETNVGRIEVDINPTDNPDLQVYVDNLRLFVEAGSYDGTVINRADESNPGVEFVIQMGGFRFDSATVGGFTAAGITPVPNPTGFTPVIVDADDDGQPDFDTTGLTNTPGTVAYALSAFPGSSTTNPDSASSSFFVNLADNSFLDGPFVPFAVIEDLTTINAIAALDTENLSTQAGAPGSLAFTDIPVTGAMNDEFVVIERAFFVVPEPASGLIALVAGAGAVAQRRKRRANA